MPTSSSIVLALLVLAPLAQGALPQALQRDAGIPGDAPDNLAQGRFLATMGEFGGELAYPLDYYDHYAVTLTAGVRYRFTLEGTDGPALELRTPQGTLAVASNAVYTSTYSVDHEATVSGVHTLTVRVFGVAEVPYVFSWELAPVQEPVTAAPVVVVTFDTGTNPYHPCWRRAQTHPRDVIPQYPASSTPLPLTFGPDYASSHNASAAALSTIAPRKLYHVPGTSLSYYGLGDAQTGFVDVYPHGAQASSQIGCADYGLAPNAQIVIINWYDETGDRREFFDWVAAQAWIDVVHLNIQDVPVPYPSLSSTEGIRDVIASGKFVVIAGGNGVAGYGANYPMELSSYNGPPGSLIAGANDNGGYTYYSNLDPHVVMDGMGTLAADPDSYGSTSFSGTSSASPRITGYAARILGELRAQFGHTGVGLLTIPANAPRPASGPLADGRLTSPELHEAIRKTADPNPHESEYDGSADLTSWPQAVDTPFAVYAKMGYGEVSEHTLDDALDVLAGRAPMPARTEDTFYEISESFREAYWRS